MGTRRGVGDLKMRVTVHSIVDSVHGPTVSDAHKVLLSLLEILTS